MGSEVVDAARSIDSSAGAAASVLHCAEKPATPHPAFAPLSATSTAGFDDHTVGEWLLELSAGSLNRLNEPILVCHRALASTG